jgi:hypothetical protein
MSAQPAGRRGVRRRTLAGAVILGSVALAAAASALLAPRFLGPGVAVALPPPRFVEQARAAGLEHVYDGDFEHFVGGGVAAFDCDGDGRPELYLAGGTRPAALFRNQSPVGGPLRFSPAPSAATDLTAVTGAYPLDVDGDGRLDLAVLRHGENVLLRGLGECRFERANEAWGFDGGNAWTAAFSATWEATNALPTLAMGNYYDEDRHDEGGFCFDNQLFRPDGSGMRYGPPISLAPGWCALSMLFSDWDRSGRGDLRVSNDRHYYRPAQGEEQLWRVEPGAPPRLYTREEGWARLQLNGMGIASYDLTGDGYPEYLLTNQDANKLQTLEDGPGRPAYRDIAVRRGADARRPFTGPDTALPSTAWHAEFADVNDDGLVDLFIAKGNVEAEVGYAAMDPSNLLIGQPDGSFAEVAEEAGILTFASGRGAALVDLDLDGLLDLVVVFRRELVGLWRNTGTGGGTQGGPVGDWLALRLHQPGPNPDAVGAWTEVRAGDRLWRRELTVGGGHAGGQLGWLHFGLGRAARAEVRVQWPDGTVGPWLSVEVNGFAVLERDGNELRPWTPPG